MNESQYSLIGRDLLCMEVEMLKALFPDDGQEQVLKIENFFMDNIENHSNEQHEPLRIIITITPSTGMDDSSQFVSLQLCFSISNVDEYPLYLKKEVSIGRKTSSEDASSFISIPWRRGLSEVQCNYMLSYLYKKAYQLISECEDFSMSPPIYNLYEEAREYLTHENERQLEVSRCSICLDGFSESGAVTKLPCFHIFHTDCLNTWFHFKCRDRYDEYLKLLDRDDRGVTDEVTPTSETELESSSSSPVIFDQSLKESVLEDSNIFYCPVCRVLIPMNIVETQINVKKDEIIAQYKKEKRKEEAERKKERRRLAQLQEQQKPQPQPHLVTLPPTVKKEKKKQEFKGSWNGISELYGVIVEGVTYSNQMGTKHKEKTFKELKDVVRVRVLNLGSVSGKGPKTMTMMVEFISMELAEKFQREYNNKTVLEDVLVCTVAPNQPTTPKQE
ncbi:hypothetical protein C9374_007449 [Naegleria lovaniensis]|uniref:RING-type domain-containing protein n=1 Tax=Naegleria lovaniensis TaxID=51637 RepID=A0AA88GM45_NAELO|nr:uncharacterized protein C9374_007449 [Naegleria lovaniensis]KAG2379310.1 hypothetical protein C9374_007449 [Naegleria lovaniensis]